MADLSQAINYYRGGTDPTSTAIRAALPDYLRGNTAQAVRDLAYHAGSTAQGAGYAALAWTDDFALATSRNNPQLRNGLQGLGLIRDFDAAMGNMNAAGKADVLQQLQSAQSDPGIRRIIDGTMRLDSGQRQRIFGMMRDPAMRANLLGSTDAEQNYVWNEWRQGRGMAAIQDLANNGTINTPNPASAQFLGGAPRPAPPPPPPPTGRRAPPAPPPPPTATASPVGDTATPDPVPDPAAAGPSAADLAAAEVVGGPLRPPGRLSREQFRALSGQGNEEKGRLRTDLVERLGGGPEAERIADRVMSEVDSQRLGAAMLDPRWQSERTAWLDTIAGGSPATPGALQRDMEARPRAFFDALVNGRAEAALTGRMEGYTFTDDLPVLARSILDPIAQDPNHALRPYQNQLATGFAELQYSEAGRAAILDAYQQGGAETVQANIATFTQALQSGQLGGEELTAEQTEILMNDFAENPGKWFKLFGRPQNEFPNALRNAARLEIGGAQMGINPDGFGNYVRGMFGQFREFLSGIMDFIRPLLEGLGIRMGEGNPLDRVLGGLGGTGGPDDGREDRSRGVLAQTNGADATGVADDSVGPRGEPVRRPPASGGIIEVDPNTGQPWPDGRRPGSSTDLADQQRPMDVPSVPIGLV